MESITFFVLLVLAFCLGEAPFQYEKYKVYRILPTTLAQLTALRNLEKREEYDFWTNVRHVYENVDIMVSPSLRTNFERYLANFSLHGKILIEDVQELINIEEKQFRARSANFDWTNYRNLSEINAWLRSLARKYKGKVKIVVGGKTYEHRNILGVRVSFKRGNKGVFLEGGIHAREWVATSTVTFILNELLTSNDPIIREVAESHDWYIFPSINPDGYEYTKTYRLWRKTRSKNKFTNCIGTDLNRNWGYHWMEGGASRNACAENFAGRIAFSEIETRSLSEYISSIAHHLDTYIAFHSYLQLILLPFGHAKLEVPENNYELHKVGNIAARELAKRYGTRYKVGNVPQAIYVASGSSADWVRGMHRHIRFCYTFELRDKGRYGFLLPPNQIIPTGRETLDAVVSIVRQSYKVGDV